MKRSVPRKRQKKKLLNFPEVIPINASVHRVVQYRNAVHKEFDLLWQEGLMTRDMAYFFLQYILGEKDPAKAHFGVLMPGLCKEVIDKLRRSYTIPAFYRFLARTQFHPIEILEIQWLDELPVKKSDAKKLYLWYCSSCHRWRQAELFSFKRKKRCDECRAKENEPAAQPSPHWIGTPEFMKNIGKRFNDYHPETDLIPNSSFSPPRSSPFSLFAFNLLRIFAFQNVAL